MEHLKNNLNIDLSASFLRSFVKNEDYYDRATREYKKYFISETDKKERLEFAKNNINTLME